MSSAGELITLDFPLTARHASTVRVVAASLAADCGFNIDEIDDLRLGINEAVSIMTDVDAPAQARLLVEFEVRHSTIAVAVRRSEVDGLDRRRADRRAGSPDPRRRRRRVRDLRRIVPAVEVGHADAPTRSDGRSRRRRVVRRVPTEPAAQCQEPDRRTSPRAWRCTSRAGSAPRRSVTRTSSRWRCWPSSRPSIDSTRRSGVRSRRSPDARSKARSSVTSATRRGRCACRAVPRSSISRCAGRTTS